KKSKNMVQDLCIIMLTAGIVSLLFKQFKQPVVLGYIVAGMMVGPYLLGEAWINLENTQTWGEIGVLFLLFSLGLEFSFKKLLQVGNTAVIGATTIVVGMMTLGFLAGQLMGWNFINSLFLGGMLCMSSTTIVFKAIDEAGLSAHKFTKVCFGILIVEDLFAVVLMVLLSSIAVKNEFQGTALVFQIFTLLVYLGFWFISGILLIPTFLAKFKKYLNDETLTIFSIGLCLGMVMLAVGAGFSSALGAFVMGSILAETVEAERIEHLVQPMKNIFGAIFFVSVGMMINPEMLLKYWPQILIITTIVILGQILFGTMGTLLSGQSLRVSLQTGFSLVQIGEFAFIIASLGESLNVTDKSLYPIVVAVSVITTFLTPYIMRLAYPTLSFCERHMGNDMKQLLEDYMKTRTAPGKDQNWKKALKNLGSYLKLRAYMAPGINQVLRLYSKNLYAREQLAESRQALMKDVQSSLLSLDIHISEFDVPANSTYCGHTLKKLNLRSDTGANIVSIQRSGITLNIPGGENRIFPGDRLVIAGTDEQMDAFKKKLEDSLTDEAGNTFSAQKIELDNLIVGEGSALIGKTILQSGIRDEAQCVVMAVIRPDESTVMNPSPDLVFSEGDIIILAGERDNIKRLKASNDY
ncbi:MAG: cation:proton antiporter, partial [Bacteroidaceae bacterium]|nr:cation:proton antiporter [Bacteroidaceae bacterium]